ncbi:AmmeMemoRadiSam system radical SAM enzyme [Calothrix sp. PCC 6303]|uniref:AmmeMemoRadiSam system radical SAM enzyme n=1 Tax=Calothrix sp. PCC 6303 TaxID=1170562 RepID=UPI0002A0117D|nr:AmmeMemoRadiSam system radical SAM enzyme [Calothrix sp. PCC 6303]AFZ01324.1 Radical SAM domain protein [Calothrix sp. PCC 6303]
MFVADDYCFTLTDATIAVIEINFVKEFKALVVGKLKEAMLYQKKQDGRVFCQLCPHYCLIDRGKRGICQVRENQDGLLYSMVFGRTVTQNVDGVEKKPLFHFYPGSSTYSLATAGCNFHCQYCTNWQVSQMSAEEFIELGVGASPEQIVNAALESGCRSIAYTYVEPTIFFEYVHEIASLAHSNGLLNVFKTNGFMTPEMLQMCQPYLDAANVDLKAFQDKSYQKFGGRLQPVLDSLKLMKSFGIWLEITTVIIPGINDEPQELADIAGFIVQELGVDTPWHITRFFPAYKMENVPPTPLETLYKARDIGLEQGLKYIYFGNFLGQGNQDTNCPDCGTVLIQRRGFEFIKNQMQSHQCPACETLIPGVGLS